MDAAERERVVEGYVKRILAAGMPEAIVLLGSSARGNAGPESDVDLLVIEETRLPRTRRARRYQLALRPRPLAVDVLVRTRDEVARDVRAGVPFMVDAVREGRVLYGHL